MNKPRTLDYTIYVNLQRDGNLAGDGTDIDCHQTVPVHLTNEQWLKLQSKKGIQKHLLLREYAIEQISNDYKRKCEDLLFDE